MSARRHLGTMDTVVYFDVFKKSDLMRILPDTVMKDIRRSPVIKLETTNYQELLDIVQQIIKDHHWQVVPMEMVAVDTTSNDVDGCCRDHETESISKEKSVEVNWRKHCKMISYLSMVMMGTSAT